MLVETGQRAPDFTLPSHLDQRISLSSYRGKKNVVIAFFPLAWTPTCGDYIPSYQTALSRFEGLNTQVLGISVDSVPSLKAWARELGEIAYPLLSDFCPHGEVARRYSVLRKEGYSERAIFAVDTAGIVRYRAVHELDEKPDPEKLFQALQQMALGATRWPSQPEAAPGMTGSMAEQATHPPEQAAAVSLQPSIIMYCTPWCSVCREAKQYLELRKLPYTMVDVTKDGTAERKARGLAGGKLVTPTFEIAGSVIVGFDLPALHKILNEA